VLVVDDDAGVRGVVAAMLARRGYEVIAAADGLDASEMLALAEVDLVVTDVSMPRRSGFELLDELRAQRPHLPVILMTSAPTGHGAREATRLGARGYLTKPVPMVPLLAAVEDAIGPDPTDPAT
jgi:DNA-binding NtrC family response regulator